MKYFIIFLLLATTVAASDVFIALGDDGPVTDTLLALDIIEDLKNEGYDIPPGSTILESEIKDDDEVVLLIYEGEAEILFSENNEDLVDDIEAVLDENNVPYEVMEETLEEIQETVHESCEGDENNSSIQGTSTYNNNTFTDFCATTKELVEYYCVDNSLVTSPIPCESGCEEGRCLEAQPVSETNEVRNETIVEEEEEIPENEGFFQKIISWIQSLFTVEKTP